MWAQISYLRTAATSTVNAASTASNPNDEVREIVVGRVEAREAAGAMVLVKSAKEAWEALQARLRQSPLIMASASTTKVL
jgi:hypothetical protein